MEQVRELLPENLWKAMIRKLGRGEALRLLWPAVAGQKLASQTRLHQLRGTTLVVSVPDPQWTRSLQPLEKMILDAVNRFPDSWRAAAVEFVVEPRGTDSPASPVIRRVASQPGPQLKGAPKGIIGDERCREAFNQSEQKYFARQEESEK
ncbi:MAG: DUF721 domain-containing protein [Acidobacteria bacterium]|nr:DUF721 domain-containing protein [Acidobacteriota bacterium]